MDSTHASESLRDTSGGRFALSEQEVRDRTSEYLRQVEAGDGRYVGTLISPDSPLFDAVCSVERQVFEQAFAGNDAAYMEEKYGPLTEASRFLVVIEKDEGRADQGRPIAFMRIVSSEPDAPSTVSLDDAEPKLSKTPKAIAEAHGMESLGRCWDVATLGVIQEYHNTLTSIDALVMLDRMFLRLAAHEGVEHMVAILDQKALGGLLLVGTPLVPMGDPSGTFDNEHAFSFDGSEKSYGVYAHVPSIANTGLALYGELEEAARTDRGKAGIRQMIGRILMGDAIDPQIILPSGA